MITMDIGGVAEIAEEFGVGATNVSMWASRRKSSGFPEPITHLKCGPIYSMEAVRRWHQERYGEVR
jgi:hypothetical protein